MNLSEREDRYITQMAAKRISQRKTKETRQPTALDLIKARDEQEKEQRERQAFNEWKKSMGFGS